MSSITDCPAEFPVLVALVRFAFTVISEVGTVKVSTMAEGAPNLLWNHGVVYPVTVDVKLLILSLQPVTTPVVVPGAVIGPAICILVALDKLGALRSAVLNVAVTAGTARMALADVGHVAETKVFEPVLTTLALPLPAFMLAA